MHRTWYCEYTASNRLWTDRIVQFWNSSMPMNVAFFEKWHDRIHKDWDTISDLVCREATSQDHERFNWGSPLFILSREYKEN